MTEQLDKTVVGIRPYGAVRIVGEDRVDLLHRLSTNDLQPLSEPGRVQTTLFTSEKGKLVDWVWALSTPDAIVLQCSSGRAPDLVQWIDKFVIMEDVGAEDHSETHRWVVCVGPDAARAAGLEDLPPKGESVLAHGVRWFRGLDAFGTRLEGIATAEDAEAAVQRALDAGAEKADEAKWERLRVRAGVPASTAEFEQPINPLELRLAKDTIHWNKGCYIGQEVIARMDTYNKIARQMMGFEAGREALGGVPERGVRLKADGRVLGKVTSAIEDGDVVRGLAVVKTAGAQAGALATLDVAGEPTVALSDRPFWSTAAQSS